MEKGQRNDTPAATNNEKKMEKPFVKLQTKQQLLKQTIYNFIR